eukprot:jgi/Bigna1/86634/estExt_fgenesh1_pg.C_120109
MRIVCGKNAPRHAENMLDLRTWCAVMSLSHWDGISSSQSHGAFIKQVVGWRSVEIEDQALTHSTTNVHKPQPWEQDCVLDVDQDHCKNLARPIEKKNSKSLGELSARQCNCLLGETHPAALHSDQNIEGWAVMRSAIANKCKVTQDHVDEFCKGDGVSKQVKSNAEETDMKKHGGNFTSKEWAEQSKVMQTLTDRKLANDVAKQDEILQERADIALARELQRREGKIEEEHEENDEKNHRNEEFQKTNFLC